MASAICVRYDGKEASILTYLEEKVSKFKFQVAEVTRAGYNFTLKWKEGVLEEDKTLKDYGIQNGEIVLVQDISFKLLIQGPAPLCEEYTLNVSFSTKLCELRQDIATHHEYSNPSDIDLRWNGQMLLANKTIGYYKIKEGDVIVVAERIASRLEPVKERRDTMEIEVPHFHSPSNERKVSKIENSALSNCYSKQLKSSRSESMPDLSLPSPVLERKKRILTAYNRRPTAVSENIKIKRSVFK